VTRRRSASARSNRAGVLFVCPFLAFFAAFFVAPIGYAVYQSTLGVKREGILGLGGSRTIFVGVRNYASALSDHDFLRSIQRVVAFGLIQVPLMLVLATVLALLLDAASARWIRFFRTSYFLPYGVPGVISSILWSFLYLPGISPIVTAFHALGLNVDLLNGSSLLVAIGNILIWQFTGYNMLVIVAQLQALPRELLEAAGVDGANAWQTVRYVKIPWIAPALTLTAVFTLIGMLQLFAEPLVLQSISADIGAHYTPNLSAYTEAFSNNNYSLAAAESVILALATCVLSFGLLRVVGAGRRGHDR
jgi:multiple sugar transport system permease protein